MSTANNGPAFPLPMGSETVAGCEGMTLRDYFAAKSLQSLVSGRSWGHINAASDEELMDTWARSAYGLADAMLKAREVQS